MLSAPARGSRSLRVPQVRSLEMHSRKGRERIGPCRAGHVRPMHVRVQYQSGDDSFGGRYHPGMELRHESIIETLDILGDPEMVKTLRASLEDLERGRVVANAEAKKRPGR